MLVNVEALVMLVLFTIVLTTIVVVIKKTRCPNCGGPIHRIINSNIWMCENRDCGYSEVRHD
jgi:ribosomal protein L37AE/L43A